MKGTAPLVAGLFVAAAACSQSSSGSASARRSFGDTVSTLLLDTTLYELRGHLFVKILNPNRDDESPLADMIVPHPATPGPHTMDGKLYAELGALRTLLGSTLPVRVDTGRGEVFVGNPPVLLMSHQHGNATYVPVKLFARQFGAYADIGCTLANCGHIWPKGIVDSMIKLGATGGSGILEGFAEGIIRGIDVTRRPGG